ncbi:MAG: hypothetical protein DHS80DRAFT_30853 [Piptocephalis tieghemiana]|nr:MAG: hypothetical protein DHS80DRAFT_30853 [Piptocephalis tieghemiana]
MQRHVKDARVHHPGVALHPASHGWSSHSPQSSQVAMTPSSPGKTMLVPSWPEMDTRLRHTKSIGGCKGLIESTVHEYSLLSLRLSENLASSMFRKLRTSTLLQYLLYWHDIKGQWWQKTVEMASCFASPELHRRRKDALFLYISGYKVLQAFWSVYGKRFAKKEQNRVAQDLQTKDMFILPVGLRIYKCPDYPLFPPSKKSEDGAFMFKEFDLLRESISRDTYFDEHGALI